jgi:quercetin dioxygenase-like cupin family protein
MTQTLQPTALQSTAASLDQYWAQQIVGEANGNLFKVAKGIGSTNWHAHDEQDEVFIVLRGSLTIQLRAGDVVLSAGDLFVIPRGVEHCPRADDEVHFMLVGPSITSNEAGGKPAWSFENPS